MALRSRYEFRVIISLYLPFPLFVIPFQHGRCLFFFTTLCELNQDYDFIIHITVSSRPTSISSCRLSSISLSYHLLSYLSVPSTPKVSLDFPFLDHTLQMRVINSPNCFFQVKFDFLKSYQNLIVHGICCCYEVVGFSNC